ncbi:MAG: undecaprenyldiphospho-muramoylpentapeptide beta-N-acetylglucosaminyltransferase [Clostridia bacterium]|nr:undecaprenyldiphospho-muramoylpentapeptide beta-N-acetylglucosaminyltransferase [Clostridia bacterium]MBR3681128.1 undecaprenyldiphospho-muramoylpentapeptide beta-N-acetylglucosaminyltransferase [Clostridia bacterium]
MKIVFCGGGTGGHITPMLAMADILRQNGEKAEVFFIGRRGGKENEAIRRAGFEPYEIEVTGLSRSLSPSNIGAVLRALSARREAKAILKSIAPDAVVGTGGYVAWPVLSAAKSLGIRRAIHESNAVPGLVTRLCCRSVDLVMLGYGEAEKRLPRCSCAVTGNPVRGAVGRVSRSRARAALGIGEEKTVVLSFGGSLGAEAINRAMCEAIRLDGGKSGILFIHATGRRDYEKYKALGGENARIIPYVEDMPTYLAAADIAVTRCGAMTLAELEAAGVPSILIPSPNVTANHQYENARALCECGAAVMITEAELSAEALYREILALKKTRAKREKMRAALYGRGGRCDGKIHAALRTLLSEK